MICLHPLRLFNEQGWAAYQHINNIYASQQKRAEGFGPRVLKLGLYSTRTHTLWQVSKR
jgi:hypothetical protein